MFEQTEIVKILCVDDNVESLELLEALLVPKGFKVKLARDGKTALSIIEVYHPDIILLDVVMPYMDGYEVCKKIKGNDKTKNIPVIMVTVLRSKEDRIESIEAGAEDFISKPVDAHEILARIKMLVRAKEAEEGFVYAIYALARAAEVNDEDTGNHILRLGEYCAVIARQLGMSEGYIKAIRLQSVLHDVGKLHIPPNILKKPGKLTEEEQKIIREHTLFGAKIIGEHARFAIGKAGALTHHEKWDGSGYPYGMKGEEIPIEGRIIIIADSYDAIRNKRVYKPPYDHKTACDIITKGDERLMPCHFDPKVLAAFKETEGLFEKIYEQIKDKT
ncbi:MAG: response regulator [bacterium]|nr:response regulator [bacterium]